MIFGLNWIDAAIIVLYFAITLYIGVYKGGRKTKSLGDFFVAGGKGKASRKTPSQIEQYCQDLSMDAENLIYSSKMSAKDDNTA